jgi:hypothetical protein
MDTELFLLMTRPQQIQKKPLSQPPVRQLEDLMAASFFSHPNQGYMTNRQVIEGFNDTGQLQRDLDNFKQHTYSELERLEKMIEYNVEEIKKNTQNIKENNNKLGEMNNY